MGCGLKPGQAKIAGLRILVGFFNFLLGVYSLFLLFCSVVVYLSLEHYISVEQDLSYALPVFLFSLSVSTFCLSFLACCCLIKQGAPPPLGYLYSLCLGSLYLIELITVLITFIFRERVTEALKEGIYHSMEMYGREPRSNQAVDLLQSKVGCCGVTDYTDWEHTVWGKGHKRRLPHSCCIRTTSGVCQPSASDAVLIKDGCYSRIVDIMEENCLAIITFVLVATFIHGAAVASSFFLARSKKSLYHLDEFEITSHTQRRPTLGNCEESAQTSLYTKSLTGLSTRSQSLHSPLSSKSQSLHSLLDIPPPPRPPKADSKSGRSSRKRKEVPSVHVYSEDSIQRSGSLDKLDDVSYREYPPPTIPQYSAMRSYSADQHEEQLQKNESNLYRTISRATLIDQDTGNVYQLIENRRGDQACETYLVSQQLAAASHQPYFKAGQTPARHQRSLLGDMRPQASIDLGMLQQARSQLQPVWCNEEDQSQAAKEIVEGQETPAEEVVERYLAVAISDTEQYLISSTGQTFLTEKLPSPVNNKHLFSGTNI